ncbi:MAG: GntR family transcriptional regulator [Armatimonadota bacterium]|nr:GntR family transcriptional regulator [Armatimonadota bacterium]
MRRGRENLTDRVFREIRERILRFDLKPGQRFTEHDLAEMLRVSRTPIREALNKLEQEGLVTIIPRVGCLVRQLSLREVGDLFEIRRALEILAVQQCGGRASREDLLELLSLVRREQIGVENFSSYEESFHMRIAFLSGNEPLVKMLQQIHGRLLALCRLDLARPWRQEHVHRDHVDLARLLHQGELTAAMDLMSRHILKAREHISLMAQEGLAPLFLS